MEPVLVVGLLVPPVLMLLVFAGYAYMDAPEYGMDPVKWAAISFFVPLFGFFAYLFERDERKPSPDRDMFVDGVFEIHESRADDTRLANGVTDDWPEDDEEEEGDGQPEDEPDR